MTSEIPIAETLVAAQRDAVQSVARPGDWLTGAQRVEVWNQARESATSELDAARLSAISPTAVAGSHPPLGDLSAQAVEVVHRVASDPGRLTRSWADDMMGELGEETYTEIVGVTAITMLIDRFALATGSPQAPLPRPTPGEPECVRPDAVGDVGAWVSQDLNKTRANVSRTLSLVPRTNEVWRALVDSHYSRGTDFYSLHWTRALTRPQVELVAARTTSLNECFY